MGLKFEIGENPQVDGGFKVLLDGKDVTERLRVISFETRIARDELTVVKLECYADGVDVLAGQTDVKLEPWPPSKPATADDQS